MHLDCKGARWRCQIGAEALVVRVINVFSMRLAVVNGISWGSVLGTLLVKRCENFPRAVHIGSGTRSTDFLLFTIAK